MILPGYANKSTVQPKMHGSKPENLFDMAQQIFYQSEKNSLGSLERFYSIAGHVVCLRFAGASLMPLITPAFEHLSCPKSSKPELTICIFDSVSTNTEMPSLTWSSKDYLGQGEEKEGHNNGVVQTCFDFGTGVLNIFRRDVHIGIFWVRDARLLPYWESGAPLRMIFHWWLTEHKIQMLHASAVGTPEGGVLLVGKGGSGKSTSALMCLQSDLKYVADDYCLLAVEPIPFVHSLYSSGKANAADRFRFPYLESALSNAEKLKKEKALYFFHKHFPEKISRGFVLKAILIPHISTGTETKVSIVSAAAALRALAPSTIFQLSGAGDAAFRLIAAVTRKSPVISLHWGRISPEYPGLSKI